MNLHDTKNNIPWIEKYRPTNFDTIVLDPFNRQIFQKILEKNYFPNLLFYGPPGTGKTTTIINLIQAYQSKYHQISKSTVIHLNASDERGIDIIRNQIYQFVRSNNLFESGIKFVILDEVDYMTKNAQQALKQLLQISTQNVRFCLICNYISKIDESLKNEFIAIRFNQLPKKEIHTFIRDICYKESIEITDNDIDTVQQLYDSDIRSMINFIQLNQSSTKWEKNIITNEIYLKIFDLLVEKCPIQTFLDYIQKINIQYNTDKRNIINNFLQYIIYNKPSRITISFLNMSEFIIHNIDVPLDYSLQYLYYNFN
uniref:AAA+ ATPase domain-containing protein n=1 Tax=viral metagenome TaxID=1070528 RepID=A0A6C0I0E7_9ZZZZ